MKKILFDLLIIMTVALLMIGCAGAEPVEQTASKVISESVENDEKQVEQTVPVVISEPMENDEKQVAKEESPENSAPEESTGRQDGERFEGVIMLEGMEEKVQYEHVRSEAIGFEMDYEYEQLVRCKEPDRECFISIYDDPDSPENYIEVTCSPDDAETVATAIEDMLSNGYDISKSEFTLDCAGNCIRFDASATKNGDTPDLIQTVYIIPAEDGCRIVKAYCSFESAEGFGRRFSEIINTLKVINRVR